MPNSVDTKIVEMQFDNKQFEKNIHQSIRSLEELDKSLEMKNSSKGIKEFEKGINNINVNKLEHTLDTIEKRFSTFGIMGATVASEIAKSFVGLGKTLYNNTIGQIKSGGMSRAMNIEAAKFQLEGLKVKWDQIEADINYGVKDTAYGLDAAARAAAQLTASGVAMGEEMQKALRGISGVAAMTNSSYEEISPIFTTIAGQGRVMTMQLRQMEARGLNAAATLAEALKVSEAEVRDMVTKGKVDFKTFADAMDKAFGAHAKDANKTFTGALSNMKAALSRIGADFATPYMENARAVFVTVTGVIDGIRKQLKPFVNDVSDWMYQLRLGIQNTLRRKDFIDTYSHIFHGLSQTFRLLTSLINPISIAFRNVFPQGFLGVLSGVAEGFDNIVTNAEFSSPVITAVINVFEALFSVLKAGMTIVGTLFDIIKPAFKYVSPLGNFVASFISKIAKLITQIAKLVSGTKKFKDVGKSAKDIFKFLGDSILNALDKLSDFIDTAEGSNKLKSIFENIGNTIEWVGRTAASVFGGLGFIIAGAFDSIKGIVTNHEVPNYIQQLKDKFAGFSNTAESGERLLSSITSIFSGGFKNLPKTVHAAGKEFAYFNKSVDKNIKPGGIIPSLTKFTDALDSVKTAINDMGTTIINNAKAFGMGRGIITAFSASIIALIANTAGFMGSLKKAFKGIPSLIKQVTRAFDVPWFEVRAKAIIAGVVLGLLSLAGALWIISRIPADRLWECVGALGALIGVMTAAGILINFLGGGFAKFKEVAFSFLSFSGAIILLTFALKQIESIKVDDVGHLIKCIGALAAIMGVLALVVVEVTKHSKPFSILFGGGFMLAFAVAINLLVKALSSLTKLDVNKVQGTVSVLLKIMGMLGLIGMAVTFLTPLAGFGFLGITLAILALIKGLSMLGDVDISKLYRIKFIFEDILEALQGWFIVFGILHLLRTLVMGVQAISDLINAIKNPLKGINKGIKELGKAAEIAAVGLTFLAIAQGFYILSTIDETKFWQAVNLASGIAAGLIFVSVILTGLSMMLPKDNIFSSIGKTLQGIGVLLIGIGVALKIIDGLSDPGYSLLMMAGLLTMVYFFVKLLGALQQANPMVAMGIKTAIALGMVLTALTICIGVLSMIVSTPGGLGSVIASALAISVTVGILALVLAALGSIKDWKPALASTVGMALVIGALGAVFFALKDCDAGRIWGQAGAIMVTIGVIAGIFALLAKIKPTEVAAASVSLGVMAVSFAILTACAKTLEKADWRKMAENLGVIAGAMAILALIAGILGGIGAATEGIFTIALLGAAAAMLIMAYSCKVLADAALVFSSAAVIFVDALDKLTQVLKDIQENVQFETISEGLKKIGDSGVNLGQFIAVGAVIVLLGALGLVLTMLWPVMAIATPIITLFSAAFLGMGKAMEEFAKLNFDGYLGNIAAFAATLVGLTLILPDLLAVAGGLNDFANGIHAIDNYTASLNGNLQSIASSIDNLKTYTESLTQVFKDFPQAIQDATDKLNENTLSTMVSQMADGMIRASDSLMPNVGKDIVDNIQNGFDSEAFQPVDKTSEMINDFIDGLLAGANGREAELQALGEYIAQNVIEGSRGPGGFNENSPSKEAVEEMMYFILGLKNEAEVSDKTLKEIGEFIGKDITRQTLKEFKEGKGDITSLFSGLLQQLQTLAAKNGITIPVDFKVRSGIPQFADNDTYDLRTVSGYDPKLASIPGYQSTYRDKAKRQKYNIQSVYSTIKATDDATKALKDETNALNANTGAGGKNTKAKEENEKANDGKTSAIDEETESLGEEEEATNENSEAIREMAEQIEVVTEKYNELNATQGFRDKFKIARSTLLQMGEAFHTTFRSTKKDANGVETVIKKTYGEVSQIFNSTRANTKKTTDAIAKGLYAFDAATGKYDRKLTKRLQKGSQTAKKAEKQAIKTGKTIAKVYEGYAKIFTNNNGSVEKMTVRLTKKIKNLGKYVNEASSFVKSFNTNIHEAAYVEDFTSNLRNIEKFFYKRKNMPQKVQDYLGDILSQFKGDFKDAMNILAKSIDGIGDYWNKGAQNTAYVADSMVQLAAALYDGSDAANEYWTQIARLEFLYENGEATLEELEEAKRPYLERAIEVLKEFYDTLFETIGGQFDPFSEFDKKVEDSTKNLLDAIQSQIVGFNNWGDMLVALGQRGADFNLMKQLAEQGVESYGLVENLLTMTSSQLALYNKYYRMMDSVKKKATDSAIAAMANARAMASLRAAAESGTLSEKQQQKQRNLAKRMTDDIKSVANAQAYYNNMTKKQERDYIKTLDKKGKAEYKAQLKAAKAAKALNDRIAAEEEARRVEENRIDTILETVKGYESLIAVINQYSNDTGVMTKINEKLNKSFEQVFKYAGNDKTTILSWLEFGKILGVEEEDSENAESYLSSLSSSLNNFIDSLKNALYDVKSLFTKFVEATEKTNIDKMFTNASSVVRASRQFGDYIQKLADLGYDQKAINYFVSKFESDKANALVEMEALLNGDIKRNKVLFEYAINAGDKIKEKAMQQAARAVTESAKKDKQQAYNLAKAEAESATRIVEGMQRGSSDYQNEVWNKLNDYGRNIFDREEELRNSIRNFVIESGGGVETSKLESFISESYKKYANDFANELNDIKKIQGGSIEQRALAIKNLLDQSPLYKEIYEAQAREYENSKRHLEESINRFHQMEISEPRNIQMEDIIRFEEATKALNKLNEEYKKSIPYIYNQAQAEVKAEFDKAKANAEAKKKTADARKKELEAIEKQLQSYQKEAEMLMTYDDALYEVQRKLKDMGETYSNFTSAIKQAGWSTEFIRKACDSFRAALLPVNNALSYARHRFAEWAKGSAAVLVSLDKMDEGFLKFASTLDKTNNESGNFMEDLGSRLEEYRKTLDSTIKGQVQLFDEFKKYSGEKATGANTYLDNMISQTEGLAQWLTNLETLAKRGVAKEVVQMFAAEGQNSFEKVEAFAKASNEQLAELNKRYKDYSKLASEAADRALAAVGAAYTAGAEAMQDKLVNSFKERAKDQIEQSAYEAATMVVTGVKNGINNARPELVAEIDGIATAITNTVGKTLTAKDIEESIRKGLVSMSGAIQNTVGVIVTDFLDNVTNTSVQKFKMAVDQCRMYIEQNLPREFTITIHVNSSEMDDAIARMNMAIDGTNVIANRTSAVVTQSQIHQEDRELYPLNAAPGNVTNVNYTQNNYSPTALSRAEIYRQTQNQLSTIQGVVSAS